MPPRAVLSLWVAFFLPSESGYSPLVAPTLSKILPFFFRCRNRRDIRFFRALSLRWLLPLHLPLIDLVFPRGRDFFQIFNQIAAPPCQYVSGQLHPARGFTPLYCRAGLFELGSLSRSTSSRSHPNLPPLRHHADPSFPLLSPSVT